MKNKLNTASRVRLSKLLEPETPRAKRGAVHARIGTLES